MRIALHAEGEAGRRAGRILTAEPSLTALGLYGHGGGTEDRRTTRITTLAGYDPLVTDAPDARSFAVVAAEEGVSCVVAADLAVDRRLARRFLDGGLTLLVGAGLCGGIAEVLAAHEQARLEEVDIEIAWTVEGRPLRRGHAVPFPDPVGPRWARRLGRRPRRRRGSTEPLVSRFEAPGAGTWGGAFARVAGRRDDRQIHQVVGVADHAGHLAGLTLAAGAISVAEGAFPPGVHRPAVAASAYLQTALRIGLGVASYSAEG